MSVPRVYAAIAAVAGELSASGIARRHVNRDERYDYRSIDDLYQNLSPLLAKHRLCILPRVVKRSASEHCDTQLGTMVRVTVRVAFDLVSAEDGSRHSLEAFGEALDPSDKATAKAMTAAYKQAMFQAFCIPFGEPEDSDARSFRLKPDANVVEPVQGWARWGGDLMGLIAACESHQAVENLKATNRDLLRALAMHEARLYAQIGEAIRSRREKLASDLSPPSPVNSPARPSRKGRPRERKVPAHA